MGVWQEYRISFPGVFENLKGKLFRKCFRFTQFTTQFHYYSILYSTVEWNIIGNEGAGANFEKNNNIKKITSIY